MEYRNYFSEAIRLAWMVKGNTSPNPAVGCVIVKNNEIIGEGATQKAGFDHAEVIAIRKAGANSRGATLFVTLEPCVCYEGKKTLSCAEAIIKAGIKRVFIGSLDPNPRVYGKGMEILSRAGIEVKLLDEYKKDVGTINEDFFKYIQTGLPFVTLKAAITLDGNIAAANGDSQWISGEESLKWVHTQRNRVDGVLVGIGTVLKDNPQLNVRLVNRIKDPLRIILDPRGETPLNSHVMTDKGKTLFVTGKEIQSSFREACLLNHKEIVEWNTENGINTSDLVAYLGKEKQIESILVEGGSHVFRRFILDKSADKIVICVAPKMLVGRGISLVSGDGFLKMADALKLERLSAEKVGEDIFLQAYFKTSEAE